MDIWLDNGSLVDSLPIVELSNLKLAKVKINDGWDLELLERLIDEAKAEKICNTLVAKKSDNDILVWMKNKDGSFSTKSAWHYIRITRPKVEWA